MKKEELIHAYAMKSVPGRNQYTARKGYYKILNLIELRETTRVVSFMVHANWHPEGPTFENSPKFKVQLNSLYNNFSAGPKELSPEDLIGSVVEVYCLELKDYIFNGEPTSSYCAIWDIIPSKEDNEAIAKAEGYLDEIEAVPPHIPGNEVDTLEDEDPNEEDENELLQILWDQQQEDDLLEEYENELLCIQYDQMIADSIGNDNESVI